MNFIFKHPESGETKIIILSCREIQDLLEDELIDQLTCDCEPIGETNVIECNCEDYLQEFELQPQSQEDAKIIELLTLERDSALAIAKMLVDEKKNEPQTMKNRDLKGNSY